MFSTCREDISNGFCFGGVFLKYITNSETKAQFCLFPDTFADNILIYYLGKPKGSL